MRPLNGTKTHQLKPSSIAVLRSLAEDGPRRAHTINPGVRNRLHREGLVEEYGEAVRFYRITNAGRAAIS